MKLRTKLYLLLIGVIVVPIITGIGITYYRIDQSITRIETDKAIANIDHTKAYLNSLIEAQHSSLSAWLPWTLQI